ncbi:MAG: MFS transporter [Candidatus Freyarchaeum deiterrae]
MRIPRRRFNPSSEILVIVCLSAFIDTLGYGLIVPFLPQYAMTLGATDFDLALIFSSYALVQLVTVIPFGLMSDRYGRRPFMIAGMILLGVSSLLYPLARSVPLLVLGRAVQGLAASATWSSALALVADTYPGKDKGEKIGIAAGVTGVGGIAGPLVGGVLAQLNFNYPFLLSASFSLAVGVYMFFRLRETRGKTVVETLPYRQILRKALGIRNVIILIIINGLTTIFWGFLEPFMPPYLSGRFSLSSSQIGLVFGLASLTYAALRPLAGRLSDRYGRKKFIVGGMAALAVINLLIPFCNDPVSLTLCIMANSAVGTIAWTPLTPLAIESLQEGGVEAYATANSLFDLAYYVGYSVGPVIGALMSSYLGFESMFYFYTVTLVVVVIISQAYMQEIMKKKKRRKKQQKVAPTISRKRKAAKNTR